MLQRVNDLLSRCGTDETVMPPTEIFNEGWMLRLVLDWFDKNRGIDHPFALFPEARWYSEALLASEFLPETRGDDRAESFTHADGVIGHFSIQPGERGEAKLLPNANQFVVIEAKMASKLSSGVKNAPGYDQAARNVACIAHMIGDSGISLDSFDRLGFAVVAPKAQVDAGVFEDLVTKESIQAKVKARSSMYGMAKEQWYRDIFEPVLERIDLDLITWESTLEIIGSVFQDHMLAEFYKNCVQFNPLRGSSGVG